MINFLKYKKIYFLISALVIGIGLLSIILYGFKVAIDFSGGTEIEYRFNKNVSPPEIENRFENNTIAVFSVEEVSTNKSVVVKTKTISEREEKPVREIIEKDFGVKATVLRFETVGGALGRENTIKTITASLVAIVGILLYMTFAFKNIHYGVAAILAMLHDFLVVVGTYSLFSRFLGAEVDTLFITALLTTMSFSVHDTIVVFDKIREYRRYDRTTEFATLTNKAFTETIVRSLNNSLTIILMLLALVLLGGDTIRFFALTLLVGTITGTYSSPFIAVPILEIFENRKK